MDWDHLKDKIYRWDCSWRDIYVVGATRADWKIWVDYVNKNYRVDWFNGKSDQDENRINFNVIEEFWSGNHEYSSTAKLFIEKIQINTHFFDESEIESDLDPREFNSIEDHNKLIKYMSDLSILLDKELILTPENEHETILLSVIKGNVEFGENIDPANWKIRMR